jgi:hypothetical protein
LLTASAAGANTGDLSASLDGTELLKALTSTAAADTYTGITTSATDDKVYLAVNQGGVTYLYAAEDADSSDAFEADEIILIGTFDAVLDAGSFTLL